MAEKPILFNTEMVRAVLDGRKTQTRRLVKGLPLKEPHFTVEDGKPLMCDENGDWYPLERFSIIQPGDILWVRETWNINNLKDDGDDCQAGFIYKAAWPPDYGFRWAMVTWGEYEKYEQSMSAYFEGWRPSIHMPRNAARLFLRVKEVRAQRLQDITSGEAVAEGIKSNLRSPSEAADALIAFEELWNSTIKKADLPWFGWDANPWVWVFEFERIDRWQHVAG